MQPADSSATPSFSGLLAALTAPAQAREPDLDDGLADDIAELSYERALRAQARREGSPESVRGEETEAAGTGSGISSALFVPQPADPAVERATDAERVSITEADLPPGDRRTRSDRITLRMSRPEFLQLRARAAESGLTVSAYLRTCILEVESLRAQVKDALAQMSGQEMRGKPQPAPARRRFGPMAARRWGTMLFSHRKSRERAECA